MHIRGSTVCSKCLENVMNTVSPIAIKLYGNVYYFILSLVINHTCSTYYLSNMKPYNIYILVCLIKLTCWYIKDFVHEKILQYIYHWHANKTLPQRHTIADGTLLRNYKFALTNGAEILVLHPNQCMKQKHTTNHHPSSWTWLSWVDEL